MNGLLSMIYYLFRSPSFENKSHGRTNTEQLIHWQSWICPKLVVLFSPVFFLTNSPHWEVASQMTGAVSHRTMEQHSLQITPMALASLV